MFSKKDIPSLADKGKMHPFTQEYGSPFPKGRAQERLLTKHAGEYVHAKLRKL